MMLELPLKSLDFLDELKTSWVHCTGIRYRLTIGIFIKSADRIYVDFGCFMKPDYSLGFYFRRINFRMYRLIWNWSSRNSVPWRRNKGAIFRPFVFIYFFFILRDNNGKLDYSCETGMIYPPEGLFYIEMDPAPPGNTNYCSHCLSFGVLKSSVSSRSLAFQL